jgi:putative mRNA 3-end processing factor
MSLLEFTERGVYCQRAGIFIDPWDSVPRALITHAHSDHARAGCHQYLCTSETSHLLRHRIGTHHHIQSIAYGETLHINGVTFSFHPAGHIVGSAQIRVEYNGEVWVVSGDYKLHPDNLSSPFELVKCHTFVTESTFGLPVYQWPHPEDIFAEINAWWQSNRDHGITSVIAAYTLGKAQRIIQNVDTSIGPILCHGTVESMNETIRKAGIPLNATRYLSDEVSKEDISRALVIAPSSALSSPWMKRFKESSTGAASGWMMLRGRKRWQNVDRGFILSDHVDWTALNATVIATECERVIVTHGYSDIYAKWLRDQGYEAHAERTSYEGENEENEVSG